MAVPGLPALPGGSVNVRGRLVRPLFPGLCWAKQLD